MLGDLGKTTRSDQSSYLPGSDVSTAQRPSALPFGRIPPACGPEPIAEQAPEVANKFSLGEDNYILQVIEDFFEYFSKRHILAPLILTAALQGRYLVAPHFS